MLFLSRLWPIPHARIPAFLSFYYLATQYNTLPYFCPGHTLYFGQLAQHPPLYSLLLFYALDDLHNIHSLIYSLLHFWEFSVPPYCNYSQIDRSEVCTAVPRREERGGCRQQASVLRKWTWPVWGSGGGAQGADYGGSLSSVLGRGAVPCYKCGRGMASFPWRRGSGERPGAWRRLLPWAGGDCALDQGGPGNGEDGQMQHGVIEQVGCWGPSR